MLAPVCLPPAAFTNGRQVKQRVRQSDYHTKELSTMGDAPFMYWVGMNTAADTSPQELAEFNDFYSHTHMHEVVVSHSGFIRINGEATEESAPRGATQKRPS